VSPRRRVGAGAFGPDDSGGVAARVAGPPPEQLDTEIRGCIVSAVEADVRGLARFLQSVHGHPLAFEPTRNAPKRPYRPQRAGALMPLTTSHQGGASRAW
jgi:hypothetical protein